MLKTVCDTFDFKVTGTSVMLGAITLVYKTTGAIVELLTRTGHFCIYWQGIMKFFDFINELYR